MTIPKLSLQVVWVFLVLSLSLIGTVPVENETYVERNYVTAFDKIDLTSVSQSYSAKDQKVIALKNVNFGTLGASGLTLNVNKAKESNSKISQTLTMTIERWDSKPVATFNLNDQSDGDISVNGSLEIAAGVHDVYLSWSSDGPEPRLNSVQFYMTRPKKGIWYFAISLLSGRALDNSCGRLHIMQFYYHDSDCQRFLFEEMSSGYYKIIAKNGRILEAKDAGRSDNNPLQLNEYRGWDNQLWSLEARPSNTIRIRARHSGHCVNVQYSSVANSAIVNTFTCNGNPAQDWILLRAC